MRHLIRSRASGQALVEFSLAIPVFLLMLMGIFDLGRGIYTFNGVSQAAREIARTESVRPTDPLGQSTETLQTIAVQKKLVPAMSNPTFACSDFTGAASTNVPCASGDYVKVTVSSSYTPISLLGILGPITLTSSSSIEIP